MKIVLELTQDDVEALAIYLDDVGPISVGWDNRSLYYRVSDDLRAAAQQAAKDSPHE